MAGWDNPPAVILLYGNDDFHINREVQRAKYATAVLGRRVEDRTAGPRVIGELKEELLWTPDAKVLLVISDPENMNAEEIAEHAKARNNQVSVLLVRHGDLGTGQLATTLDGVPKKYRIRYNTPAPYKQAEAAAKFMVEEMSFWKKDMPLSLAEQLVGRVGSDFGVLSFEALKIAHYMDALGEGPKVERHHVVKVMSQIGTDELMKYLNALAVGSGPRVLQALAQVKESSKDDPLMKVIAFTQASVLPWLMAAECLRQGLDEKQGAARLEMNPWVYTNKILPPARRWGTEPIKDLLRRLDQTKAGVVQGHLNPWVELMTHLAQVCAGVSQTR